MRLLSAICLIAATVPAGAQPTLALTNGHWFDGRTFTQRTMYVAGGVFRSTPPERIDSTLDLGGGFVVPPFGEAHNHNIEASARVDAALARYLAEGIFYVLNPNVLPRSREGLGDKVNGASRVDAIFANGGLNVTGGHPWPLVQRNIARGIWTGADGEGSFHHTIDSLGDLTAKWPRIAAARPDFIKVYLLHSDEFERRMRDSTVGGAKGLDPSIVPAIVQRARGAGLRVAAHIENASDFESAVNAGVDIILHMPGYAWQGVGDSARYAVTAAQARAAAARGVSVVTTLAFGQRANPASRTPAQQRRDALNAANLRTLKEAGVRLAVGSDNYGSTSRSEVLYLSDLGVFSNAELLRMWSVDTPRLIFPARRIGEFGDGFEASFVVLEANPLADFAAIARVKHRVKQGHVLTLNP